MSQQQSVSGKVLILNPDSKMAAQIADGLKLSVTADVIHLREIEEAIALARTGQVDVLITEAQLPDDKSGCEVAFEVRKERVLRPEIILLASEPEQYLFESHQAGVSLVLPKPLNLEQLASAVRRSIGNQRRFERAPVDPKLLGKLEGPIGVVGRKEQHLKAEVSNIGRGGFFYKIPTKGRAPEVGQVVEFELRLGMVPDCVFKGKGVIRWTRYLFGEMGVGVEFVDIPEDSEKLVMAFVELFKVRPFVPADEG